MSDIRYLPGARQSSVRLLERAVGEAIGRHPDPEVAHRWSVMARETIARWPGPPEPSRPPLDLRTGLDDTARARMLDVLERWMDNYFGDVRDQLMDMHGEMLALQRRVAELEAWQARSVATAPPESAPATDKKGTDEPTTDASAPGSGLPTARREHLDRQDD